jgi:hypothetical protein
MKRTTAVILMVTMLNGCAHQPLAANLKPEPEVAETLNQYLNSDNPSPPAFHVIQCGSAIEHTYRCEVDYSGISASTAQRRIAGRLTSHPITGVQLDLKVKADPAAQVVKVLLTVVVLLAVVVVIGAIAHNNPSSGGYGHTPSYYFMPEAQHVPDEFTLSVDQTGKIVDLP